MLFFRNIILTAQIGAFFFITPISTSGQAAPIHFSFINPVELSGIGNFWHSAIDSSGVFWISSTDGIISYDGYHVQHYTMETHPQMRSNVIGFIFCDSKNQLWASTGEMPIMIDANRQVHRIAIPGYGFSEQTDRAIFEKPGGGYIAITYKKCFSSPDGLGNWKEDSTMSKLIGNNGLSDIKPFDSESLLCVVRDKKVMIVNFVKNKITMQIPLKHARTAVKINDRELMIGTQLKWQLYKANVSRQSIVDSFAAPFLGKNMAALSGINQIENGLHNDLFISTQSNGLIHLNLANRTFSAYTHNLLNKKSIGSNQLRNLTITSNGRLLVTSDAGIHFANLNYPAFNRMEYWQNEKGEYTNPNLNAVLPLSAHRFLLLSPTVAYTWNSISNSIKPFIHFSKTQLQEKPIAYAAFQDDRGNIWIGFQNGGIRIYNSQGGLIKHLFAELPHTTVRCFEKGPGNQLWVGTANGLFSVNIHNYTIDSFANRPGLKPLANNNRVVDLFIQHNNLWIATSPYGALYRYHIPEDKLTIFDTSKGLISNRVYSIAADRFNNIYAGSIHGLSVIKPNGQIKNFTKADGLPSNRIESMLADAAGNIWFTCTKKICKYDVGLNKIFVFDHRNGISDALFNIAAASTSADGTIYFPTSSGAVYFNPSHINFYTEPQVLKITGSVDAINFIQIPKDSVLHFAYNKGKISFQVSGTDAGNNMLLYYRYKMNGLDTGWSLPSRNRTIAYNLRPGNYKFIAQASFDRVNYFNAKNPIHITVNKPLWQKTGFLITMGAILLISAWTLYQQRIKTIQKKAAIQQQLAQLEGKALRAQMNPHFIFNSLNAIQECVITGKLDAAYDYLARFSKLLRLVLNNSEKNLISLQEEIVMLQIYLELESLRFRDSFQYHIQIAPEIDLDMSTIPPLLLQPYIENAIWHGLMHKLGTKELQINFNEQNNTIICSIADNGIGRAQSTIIKAGKLGAQKFDSKGMKLSAQRMEIMNMQQQNKYAVTIKDLYHADGKAAGTNVTLYIPQPQQ